MARMTAQDMVTRVRKGLGGVLTQTLTDSEILRFINLAYQEVCAHFEQPRLQETHTVSTTANQAHVLLTTLTVDELWMLFETGINRTTGTRMRNTDQRKYTQQSQGTSIPTGTPVEFFEDGYDSTNRYVRINLWPTPDAVYSLEFEVMVSPDELVLSPSATTPVIPVVFDDEIVTRACAKCAVELGMPSVAKAYLDRSRDFSKARSTFGPAVDERRSLSSVSGVATHFWGR